MEENDRAHTVPRLCRKGCGFFGNPNFDGFCSKCHRDMQMTAEKVQSAVRLSSIDKSCNDQLHDKSHDDEISSQLDLITSSLTDLNSNKSISETGPDCETSARMKDFSQLHDELSEKNTPLEFGAENFSACVATSSETALKKRLRCQSCNKRVGLTGFTCRCGGLFCTVHRYSDSHECSFDYRELGQSDIRKANPQVVCSKINKL